jgi:hypothetical protein
MDELNETSQFLIRHGLPLNEATAAKVALLLQRHGFTRVRPLLGGIDAWREGNHPMEVRTQTITNAL